MSQLMSPSESDTNELKQIQKEIQTKEMSRGEVMRTYGVETKDRRSTIVPEFIEKIVKIDKGNSYVAVEIKKEHVGLKLGSLVRTKRIPEYKKKK